MPAAALDLPVYAVLGNHDFHVNRCDEVIAVLEEAGIHVLQRSCAVHEVGGLELGIVGAKGFVGGFPGAELPDFGEPLLREVYAETTREVEAIEAGLEQVSGCHRRVVLLHYAPIPETLVGEPEPIWAFLGSSRLAQPIGAHRPDLVLHGHAHRGTFAGELGPGAGPQCRRARARQGLRALRALGRSGELERRLAAGDVLVVAQQREPEDEERRPDRQLRRQQVGHVRETRLRRRPRDLPRPRASPAAPAPPCSSSPAGRRAAR